MHKARKILILLFVFLYTGLGAQQISSLTAFRAAKNFVERQEQFDAFKVVGADSLINRYGKHVGYIAKLSPQGFVILPSSKNVYPILSFSTEGFLDTVAEHNDFFYSLVLSDLTCASQKKDSSSAFENRDAWDRLLKDIDPTKANAKETVQFGPWIPSVWGGVNCYDDQGNVIYPGNYYTPNHYSPGCVATSLSQILYRYKWPIHGMSSHTDYDNSGSSQGSYYANFYTTYYDWGQMLDEYYHKSSTLTQQKAAAKLQFHCGISVDMDYESDGSTSNINRTPAALSAYWRYTGHYEDISWSNFWSRLDQNLENGHPVQLAIKSDDGAGHAIAVDGYRQIDGGDKYYHLNMGWWGSCNAWYRISVSYNACGYTSVTGGVFDILPEPELMLGDIERTCDERTFTLKWRMSDYVSWDAFQLEQSTDGGSTWDVISSSITDTFYTITVDNDAVGTIYKYRVKAKYDGFWYYDSYSNVVGVPIRDELTFLDFDGDDSFFIYDNSNNDLDVTDQWTFETWLKVRSYANNSWSVIMDRRNVFSFYLINDADADYAVKFAVRDANDNIIASVQSDNSVIDMSFNRWYHLAVSYDGSVARLFINGNQVASSTDPDFILTSSTKALNIAARYWSNGYERYLDGYLDEIRITDTARYVSDFVPDRYARFNPDKNTRLLLHLDEGYGYDLYEEPDRFKFILLRNSPNSPNWAFESYGTKWNGQSSQDWSDAANWSDGLPFNQSLAIISSDAAQMPVIGSDVEILHLKMEDNTSLVVNYPNTLQVKGTVCNNGTLTLEAPDDSTACAMLIDGGQLLGNGVYRAKKFFPSGQWSYFSVPVGEGEVSSALFTDLPDSRFNPNLLWYDETYQGADWMLGWKLAYQGVAAPSVLDVMKGYAYFPESDYFVYFKGKFNTGTYRIVTTYTDSDDIDEHDGWNFVGNPYPSSVDWDNQDGWIKQNIDNSIYLWNGTNYSYYVGTGGTDYHTGIGVNGGSSIIPPMQGFFVKATGNGYLEVNNKARTSVSQDAYKKSIGEQLQMVKISCSVDGYSDETAIVFTPEATDNFDHSLEAYKIIFNSGRLPLIYNFASEENNVPLAIGAYNLSERSDVALGVIIPHAGNYRITCLDNTLQEKKVFLIDSFLGVKVPFEKGKEYVFTVNQADNLNDRFKLVFVDTEMVVDDNDIVVFVSGQMLNVYVPYSYFGESLPTVDIYQLDGKKVAAYKLKSENSVFNLHGFNGVYLVKLRLPEHEVVKKILVF